MRNLNLRAPAAQSGAVLIVSLIMLLVLTVLGVSTMESTGLEMKMAGHSRDRMVTLQAAEAGLRAAETYIESTGFDPSVELADSTCSTASQHCFKANCSDGGFCFDGSNADNNTGGCSLNPRPVPYWHDKTNIWDNPARHQTVAFTAAAEAEVKYIVEFRCYVLDDPASGWSAGNVYQLYRITSYAVSTTGNSEVMVQSTYRVKDS